MMTPSDDKFSLMNSSIGPQRVMALELKQATDKRIFFMYYEYFFSYIFLLFLSNLTFITF